MARKTSSEHLNPPRREGLVHFLEAAYAWEVPEHAWLAGLCSAARVAWPGSQWIVAFRYDASTVNRFQVLSCAFDGLPEKLIPTVMGVFALASPEVVARSYRSLPFTWAMPVLSPEMADAHAPIRDELGTADLLGVNGVDPIGCSAAVLMAHPKRYLLSSDVAADCRRLSTHLASAARLRRRIWANEAASMEDGATEAILSPSGQLLHAEPAAQTHNARESLCHAVVDQQAVRARAPNEPSPWAWRPAVSARWSLAEWTEADGRRLIAARENRPEAAGLDALTDRERQVVATMAIGRTTKETAYALGLSDSTVRVLLARAMKRLGAGDRKSLLAHPAVRTIRGEAPHRAARGRGASPFP